MVGPVEYLELHLALPADRGFAIRADVADREQGGEQREDGDSLHGFLFYFYFYFYAIKFLCDHPCPITPVAATPRLIGSGSPNLLPEVTHDSGWLCGNPEGIHMSV